MTNIRKWTLVQHSGYGYDGNPSFMNGLEIRMIENKSELRKVERVGGLIFDNYQEASDAEERLPYVDNEGLYPNARGRFSDQTIDDLRIYIPIREVIG